MDEVNQYLWLDSASQAIFKKLVEFIAGEIQRLLFFNALFGTWLNGSLIYKSNGNLF
jgi:hypothetical protein